MGKAEAYIEDYLVKQCKKHNFWCAKFTSPGTSGVPDRVVIGNGYTVFVELKRPGESPRMLQQVIITRMRNNGAFVLAIDNHDAIDKLMYWFEQTKHHKSKENRRLFDEIPTKY